MSCIGIQCPYLKKDMKYLQCTSCEGCKAHGAESDEFPLLLRKRFLFSTFRHNNDVDASISVTKIVGCLRKHYLELTTEYYLSIDSFKAMNFGTAIHNYLEPMWEIKEERLVWRTEKGNKLFGYFDIINMSERVLYDIKTTSQGKFKVGASASGHDVLQTQIYATMLKRQHNLELNGIKVVYVGLGDKICETFDVPIIDQTDYINETVDRMSECMRLKLIPKGVPQENWECRYCSFAKDCPDKVKNGY